MRATPNSANPRGGNTIDLTYVFRGMDTHLLDTPISREARNLNFADFRRKSAKFNTEHYADHRTLLIA